MGHKFWLARVATFSTVILFSLITLAVAATHISKTRDLGFRSPNFAGLAVAISVLTILVMTPLLVVDFFRDGAFSSFIIVELCDTGVFMILWLATAATTADYTSGRTVSCSNTRGDVETICRTYQATEAFAFINWLIFLFYFGTLLTFSIIAQSRKNPPWYQTVRRFDFFSRANTSPAVAVPMTQQPAYPQQTAPPQQAPYSQYTASPQQTAYPQTTAYSPQPAYPQQSAYPTTAQA